jgi:outer membrane protein OmpA-like peptidoglycan-associated protein
MQNRALVVFLLGTIWIGVAVGTAETVETTLIQVTYPERNQVDVGFDRDDRAPAATMTAEVKYREGQADISIRFLEMKPAILFGGDVTSYVLWAVSRDGSVENLGELWVRDDTEVVEYSSGQKSFAMMVTAEAHPLVSVPSSLVMFRSLAANSKRATSEEFTFSGFGPAPEIEYPSVSRVIWDRGEPLDLRQAEKAFEMAVEAGAMEYAASEILRASTTLAQARNFELSGKDKKTMDYSRRALALSSEAFQVTARKKEAERVEAEIARRRAEMEELLTRADEAEASAAEAAAMVEAARMSRAEAESAVVEAQAELAKIEADRLELQATVSALEEASSALEQEKVEISKRLQGALSQVADTQQSARGMIVSLPDILFDSNQATLKADAKIVIAKLAGILLILPELNLRVEGHTDSTGSPDYNQQLSERRAMTVRDFLAQQGIAAQRMVSVGYGLSRPVGDNATREGRAKNRRVEIVIAEGEVSAN